MTKEKILVTKNSQETIVEDASKETAADNDVVVEVKLLSAPDLQAFLTRRGAVEQAKITVALLGESYDVWAADLTKRYSIDGSFSIDTRTGQIHPVVKSALKEVADG